MPAKVQVDKVTGILGSPSTADSVLSPLFSPVGGVMPEDQNQLNAVIERSPDEVKKSCLSGFMEGVVRFSTVKMEMSEMNDLKVQIYNGYQVPAIREIVNKIGTPITIPGLVTFFWFSALCLSSS